MRMEMICFELYSKHPCLYRQGADRYLSLFSTGLKNQLTYLFAFVLISL